jgi:hypothetical protein
MFTNAPVSTRTCQTRVGFLLHEIYSLCRRVIPSHPASETVTVSLRAGMPSGFPGVTVNPAVNVGWLAEGCTGVRQQAYRPGAVYTPLFCLKSLRKHVLRRDDSSPVTES